MAIVRVVRWAINRAGTTDIKVDWTFATNDIDLFVYRSDPPEVGAGVGNCPVTALGSTQCPELARSISTLKPETLSLATEADVPYILVILNQGPGAESGTVEIVLNASASSSASQSAASVRAFDVRSGLEDGFSPSAGQ